MCAVLCGEPLNACNTHSTSVKLNASDVAGLGLSDAVLAAVRMCNDSVSTQRDAVETAFVSKLDVWQGSW
jgi:hypothetical protein